MKNVVSNKYFWIFLIVGLSFFAFYMFSADKRPKYKINYVGAKVVEYDLLKGNNEIHIWVGFEIINLSNEYISMEYNSNDRNAFITLDDSTFYKILLPKNVNLRPYESLKGDYFVPTSIRDFIVNEKNHDKIKSEIKQIKKQIELKNKVYYYDIKYKFLFVPRSP
jgi:hypothetical protein